MNTAAILQLADYLKKAAYQFVTITPMSHQRVLLRPDLNRVPSLRDIFGWNRVFSPDDLPPELRTLMQAADVLQPYADGFKSKVRFSTLQVSTSTPPLLLMHSAYPTTDNDAVFFGPDSYRYARLISAHLSQPPLGQSVGTILDLGAGSGVGGLVAAASALRYDQLLLSDISPKALTYAAINTKIAGVEAELIKSDLYQHIQDKVDVIVSNPPYLVDASARAYRHGGGEYGSLLSTRIVLEGVMV